MKKIFNVAILCLALSPIGCTAFDLFKDKEGGVHTQVGDAVILAGKTMKEVSGSIPGYGLLLSLIGGIVITTGGLITSVKRGMTKDNMLDAVVTGVQEANIPEVKKVIARVAINHKVAKKLNDRVAKVTGDPKTGG